MAGPTVACAPAVRCAVGSLGVASGAACPAGM